MSWQFERDCSRSILLIIGVTSYLAAALKCGSLWVRGGLREIGDGQRGERDECEVHMCVVGIRY